MESPQQRIVVKETVYWQSRGSNPQSVSGNFVHTVRSGEYPYSHPRIVVGEDWQPLEIGWLKRAYAVVVENLAEVRRTIPTPEEAKASEDKVLEIGTSREGVSIPFCHVRGGESTRLSPPHGNVSGFCMRCLRGEAQVTVTAFPGRTDG